MRWPLLTVFGPNDSMILFQIIFRKVFRSSFFSLSSFSSFLLSSSPSTSISEMFSDAHCLWSNSHSIMHVSTSDNSQSSCKVLVKWLSGVEHTVLYTFLLHYFDDTFVSCEIIKDGLHHLLITLQELRLDVVLLVHCRPAFKSSC